MLHIAKIIATLGPATDNAKALDLSTDDILVANKEVRT